MSLRPSAIRFQRLPEERTSVRRRTSLEFQISARLLGSCHDVASVPKRIVGFHRLLAGAISPEQECQRVFFETHWRVGAPTRSMRGTSFAGGICLDPYT